MTGHSLSKDPLNEFISASYLAIFLWMIRRCDSVMDFIFLDQLLNHMRCELWPSICDYLPGYAKVDEDVFKKKSQIAYSMALVSAFSLTHFVTYSI